MRSLSCMWARLFPLSFNLYLMNLLFALPQMLLRLILKLGCLFSLRVSGKLLILPSVRMSCSVFILLNGSIYPFSFNFLHEFGHWVHYLYLFFEILLFAFLLHFNPLFGFFFVDVDVLSLKIEPLRHCSDVEPQHLILSADV